MSPNKQKRSKHSILMSLRFAAPVLALAFVAACRGGDGGTSTTTSAPLPETTTTAPQQSTTEASRVTTTTAERTTTPPESSGPALANGTHPVYLTGVNTGQRTITVDVVQVLDPRRPQAASVCPEIAKGEIDGYCIANTNAQLRTLPLTSNASLQVLNGSSLRTVDIAGLAAARNPQKEQSFFEITVAAGKVSSVKELYRP